MRLSGKIIVVTLALALLAGVGGGLYAYLGVSPESARRALTEYADSALGAELRLDGELDVQRFPRLVVALPAGSLVAGERELARWGSASFRISVWPLALGTVRVKRADISGLRASLQIPSADPDEALVTAIGALRFPRDLRLGKIQVTDAELALAGTGDDPRPPLLVKELRLLLDHLSPEMAADFELSCITLRPEAAPALDQPTVSEPASGYAEELLRQLRDSASLSWSARGRLAFSASGHRLALERLQAVTEISAPSRVFSAVLSADALRFDRKGWSGANVSASLPGPEASNSDIHLGAADFSVADGRWRGGGLRLSYSQPFGEAQASWELTTALEADPRARRAALSDLRIRAGIAPAGGGEFSLPLNATGSAEIDLSASSLTLSLTGSLAKTGFSLSGRAAEPAHPAFEGRLSLESLDLTQARELGQLLWSVGPRFRGELRVGKLSTPVLSGGQLHGWLTVEPDQLLLERSVVNVADGRLLGSLSVARQGGWSADLRADGMSLERLLSGLGGTPLTGLLNGSATLSGSGLTLDTIQGEGRLRLLRGVYHGVNGAAVRAFVAGRGKEADVTAPGSSTPIDEASGPFTVANGSLRADGLAFRSVSLRTNVSLAISLPGGEISGTARASFAPAGSLPGIQVGAQLSGPARAPAWAFDWDEARRALLSAQGGLEAGQRQDKQQERPGMWRGLRRFFSF